MTSPKPKKRRSKAAVVEPERPEPSTRERAAIAVAWEKVRGQSTPVRLTVEKSARGAPYADASHSDTAGWMARLAVTFGTSSSDFALAQLQLLMNTTRIELSSKETAEAMNSMLAAVAGVQPRDETEGALAVQMAATHQLAMSLLERTKQAQHIPMFESNGNMAVKLLRTYTTQLEVLAKLRRGGNQTMRVEHVHVHSGGQAIIGNVEASGGGGDRSEVADQPHAPEPVLIEPRCLTLEPVPALWSEDPEREAVPVSRGEGADEVQDARWCEG